MICTKHACGTEVIAKSPDMEEDYLLFSTHEQYFFQLKKTPPQSNNNTKNEILRSFSSIFSQFSQSLLDWHCYDVSGPLQT